MTHAIRAEGLVKEFKGKRALVRVCRTARKGTVLGVLGPHGSGKTTSVRILATLLRADGGYAEVGGFDVLRHPHEVRRLIGLTGQYAAVDEELTGTQDLVLIARLRGFNRAQALTRSAELLEGFALSDAADRPTKGYSGGMRRRLDLAASMIGRPSLLYLDEPTTGLDPHSRNELWEVVRRQVEGGVTVLLTTQYLEEADHLADDLVVLDHGRVISEGTPEQLKDRAGTQVLELRTSEPLLLGLAIKVMESFAGARVSDDGLTARVPVTDSAVLPEVVRHLDEQSVAVGELSLRKPSLDEVFLALTGQPAEPQEISEETSA